MAEIKELTFWDHLDELRRVLFRIIGVWFVLAVGYFIAMPYLFDHVILAPCHNDFIFTIFCGTSDRHSTLPMTSLPVSLKSSW